MNRQGIHKLTGLLFLLLLVGGSMLAQGGTGKYPDMSYLKDQKAKTEGKETPLITSEGYYDNLEEAKKAPSKVVYLNLQDHGLKEVPGDLCQFPNLAELDLSHNQIKSINVGFSCPSALKKLYLNANQIKELPAKLATLTHLQVLVAHDNPINQIDPAIGRMKSLKELWLSGNGNISSMQPAIWGLNNLEVLRLWNFGLTQIPDAISEFKHLHTICVQQNEITSLNPKVCALPKLGYLNLGKNSLTSLPSEIRNCTQLGYLGIYENPLHGFPEDFALLSKSLERISAWQTNIPVETQQVIAATFPKTALMFEPIGLH